MSTVLKEKNAIILDGKATAATLRQQTGVRAGAFAAKFGRKPGLAVVLVGEDAASKVYVSSKRKASTASAAPAPCSSSTTKVTMFAKPRRTHGSGFGIARSTKKSKAAAAA